MGRMDAPRRSSSRYCQGVYIALIQLKDRHRLHSAYRGASEPTPILWIHCRERNDEPNGAT